MNTPEAKLLKFSKRNRYLLRSEKNNKKKLAKGPQEQYDLLVAQNSTQEAFNALLQEAIENYTEYTVYL